VRILGIPIREALHDGEVLSMPRERSQSRRQRVIRAGLFHIGIPRFLGHAEADAEEDHALRRCSGHGSGGEAAKAE
jgi:hypothetical protein